MRSIAFVLGAAAAIGLAGAAAAKTSALKSFQLAQAPGASSSGPSSGVASGSSSKSNNGSKGAEKSGGSSERPSATGKGPRPAQAQAASGLAPPPSVRPARNRALA